MNEARLEEIEKHQNPVRKHSVPAMLWKIITSYGLACVVLFLMLLLTLFGTLEQVEYGLYDTVRKYFKSWFLSDIFGHTFRYRGIGIPIPGGMLLMTVLFLNMFCGAIIRARKGLAHAGILIAHGGMLFLLFSGFVSAYFSQEGNMALYEKEEASEFESYYNWQIEILPLGESDVATEALVIPAEDIHSLKPDERRVFTSQELPFDVFVNGYYRNAIPVPTSAPIASSDQFKKSPVADNFVLLEQRPSTDAEHNLGGTYVEFQAKADAGGEGSGSTAAILWAGETSPFRFELAGKEWSARLVREKWQVPFTIRLDEFTMERHPGTGIARLYESEVTKLENGQEESIEIKMNEPLRHQGYTFFQASWGPENAGPNDRLFSVFAVVKNPADHWPLIALVIVGIGLCVHFFIKLMDFVNRSQKSLKKAAP